MTDSNEHLWQQDDIADSYADSLPNVCNCTQEGFTYCGQPDCDIDWCDACGDEYSEPCKRHAEVDHV